MRTYDQSIDVHQPGCVFLAWKTREKTCGLVQWIARLKYSEVIESEVHLQAANNGFRNVQQ